MTPSGERPGTVVVSDGKIEAVLDHDASEASLRAPVRNLGALALLPGFVDCHVHVNEPGRTEWEGFETATRSAALGGVTTIVDMPLNSSPVTTTLSALRAKEAALAGQLAVDCGLWGGVVPGNAGELEAMLDAGVSGFKCFLIHSGIDDFPATPLDQTEAAMRILAARGAPLLVHAELDLGSTSAGDPADYATFLRSRPRAWENAAIDSMIALAERTRCRTHIVHLSSGEAVGPLREARRRGVPIGAETCPHYLTFHAEAIPSKQTRFKCCPPIREHANRESLWDALREGVIEMVVSDHSPCVPALKREETGDFMAAWGGIASLQFGPAATWTEARRRGFGLRDLAWWSSARPAVLAGLAGRKGGIAPGCDADLIAFDDKASFEVTVAMIRHRHTVTPYLGRSLSGRAVATWLRGVRIQEEGEPIDMKHGLLVRRTP